MESFDLWFKTLKNGAEADLANTIPGIKQILSKGIDVPGAWGEWFTGIADLIVELDEHRTAMLSGDWETLPVETLERMNASLYEELAAYETSFANPAYAVSRLGNGYGQAAAWGRVQFREYIDYAYGNKTWKMAEYNRLFLDLIELFASGVPAKEDLCRLLARPERNFDPMHDVLWLHERFDPGFSWIRPIIESSDISDDRYLYRYGRRVTGTERGIAAFMRKYPEAKVNMLADTVFDAYIRGFTLAGKDLSKKSTLSLIISAGQERLARAINARAATRGLQVVFRRVITKDPSKQCDYDHRFDEALHIDLEYGERKLAVIKEGLAAAAPLLRRYSGIVFVEAFGEEPFAPESKKENPLLSEEQQRIRMKLTSAGEEEFDKYAPESEISFNITSFPVPDIGPRFEEIFADVCEINMMDADACGRIQQRLIDELDKADRVEVTGAAGNRTRMTVALAPLADPATQSKFENCCADVNVPVGEVFTSPRLKGTNGTLHVKEDFLWGLKYVDLELEFADGYVTRYSCANFRTENENRKYVEENLLFPHKTLPLGEFALGTNTLAYMVTEKYGIKDRMTTLITEKMGPHFAVGDTCFAHQEDTVFRNPYSSKEMTARENEKTALRKTDPENAYTQVHTDICLPYDGIGSIVAVRLDGTRTDLLRDGRFVLPGTEALNEPFDH